MQNSYDVEARKCPVKLTLNEDLVRQAKTLTGNLSGVVEGLLADYVSGERRERLARSNAVESTVAAWNAFNAQAGSIADTYSSL